jgi:hypothetical protein
VFVAGKRLEPDDVTFASPTAVTATIPISVPPGSTEISLRAGKVAGPPTGVVLS